MRLRQGMVAAIVVAAGAVNAQAATITFDGIADATIINNFYSALGVTFSCSDGSFPGTCGADANDGTNVYARTTTLNNSPTNVVSSLQSGLPGNRTNLTGVIQVDFAAPVTSVSIDSYVLLSPEGFGTPGTGFLSAFDGTTFLGSASTTSSETWQTLAVSFANITSVRFSGTPGSYPSTAWFDNLVFTSGTDGGGGNGNGETPVPEPSSLVMLAIGALGCVGVGRRNKAAV